ncbi:MAG: hypothetical protein AB1640_13155 [bacterium]
MLKILGLELKNFAQVPNKLRDNPSKNHPSNQIGANLGTVCHHLYLDTYGIAPPDPNPAYCLYSPMFTADPRLRVIRNGLGSHKEAKVGEYNRFGKAFCRWFLYEHCGITYFAHMDDILGKHLHPGFGDFRVIRTCEGDTPDYFCAESTTKLFLAEAKGTAASISFKSAKFTEWRNQFKRVTITNSSRNTFSIKGYIVATRIVSESQPRTISKLLAEDPWSRGQIPIDENAAATIGRLIVTQHYANILEKLRFPLLAFALRNAAVLPAELGIRVGVWRCPIPHLKEHRFVGGFFSPKDAPVIGRFFWESPFRPYRDVSLYPSLDLSAGGFTFFGLEMEIFKAVRKITLLNAQATDGVRPLAVKDDLPIGFSLLRDGSVIAPLEWFVFEGVTEL